MLTAKSSEASATIEVVVGPSGEVLVAIEVGIAVAPPSVLVHNFFWHSLKLHAADLADFVTDFMALVFRVYRVPNIGKLRLNSKVKIRI